MSLSGPTGLVCQVHSNVADSSCDMIWQVCGHNQIENEEYFLWGTKFRESWAPKPHGNPHRWLTSRHESHKKMLWNTLQSRLNSFKKAHAVWIFSTPHSEKCFYGLILCSSSSPLHQVWNGQLSSKRLLLLLGCCFICYPSLSVRDLCKTCLNICPCVEARC